MSNIQGFEVAVGILYVIRQMSLLKIINKNYTLTINTPYLKRIIFKI